MSDQKMFVYSNAFIRILNWRVTGTLNANDYHGVSGKKPHTFDPGSGCRNPTLRSHRRLGGVADFRAFAVGV